MATRLLSIIVAVSLAFPVATASLTPAAASTPAGPDPIATGNFTYLNTGGPMDVAVGQDRTVYVTVGEAPASRKLFRHQLTYTVSNVAITSGTATITIGSHLLKVGDEVVVDVTDASFDGTRTITATTSTTISYATTGPDVLSAPAVGSVQPDPISGAAVQITPSGLASGVALTGPRAVTVSPAKDSIAVGYTVDSGIAIYPWDASGATTPTRVLLGPAGTSARFAVRNIVWDASGNIYALMDPKVGDPAQIWVFSPTAAADSAPDRIIELNAGTSDDPTAWTGWSWSHITSGMAIDPTGQIAVAGATSLGWIIAYVDPGTSGRTKPTDYLNSGVAEVWGVTNDDSGRTIITYINGHRGLRAWDPGARSTSADPSVAPVVDVSSSGSGPTRGPIAFDTSDRSIVLANGDSFGLLRRYATGPSATTTTLALPYLGAPSAPAPPSSSPGSSAPSAPPSSGTDPATPEGGETQSSSPVLSTDPASNEDSERNETPLVTTNEAEGISLGGLVDARLLARGVQGRTCVGAQCVDGRRWTLQMCLPPEARFTVQRRIQGRWVNQKARNSSEPPLACPAPTRNVNIVGPRRAKAGKFRIVLEVQDAPRIVSGLRVR